MDGSGEVDPREAELLIQGISHVYVQQAAANMRGNNPQTTSSDPPLSARRGGGGDDPRIDALLEAVQAQTAQVPNSVDCSCCGRID